MERTLRRFRARRGGRYRVAARVLWPRRDPGNTAPPARGPPQRQGAEGAPNVRAGFAKAVASALSPSCTWRTPGPGSSATVHVRPADVQMDSSFPPPRDPDVVLAVRPDDLRDQPGLLKSQAQRGLHLFHGRQPEGISIAGSVAGSGVGPSRAHGSGMCSGRYPSVSSLASSPSTSTECVP